MVLFFTAPSSMSYQAPVGRLRPPYSPPPPTLKVSDLLGTWEAHCGLPLLLPHGAVDTLTLRANGTFMQVYRDDVNEDYVYETPWSQGSVQRSADGEVRRHLNEARYYRQRVQVAELDGRIPPRSTYPKSQRRAGSSYDGVADDTLTMVDKLVLNGPTDPAVQLVLLHTWFANDEGFPIVGCEINRVPAGRDTLTAARPVTISYHYDPLYRLTSASYSSGETYGYSYDAVGNRLSMSSPGGSTSYTYDPANRLTSAGGVAYTWDDNGNLLSDGVRNYSYDHANRLIQVTEGILTTQFAFNGDGLRVGKTIGGATTDYLLDLAATLPVVISDTDAVYLYGLDIVAEQMSQGPMYYIHDGLGSVRQLTDQTGQIADSYAYDPFGVPLSGGAVPNPWRFTGEAWDAEVELLYLRARYYQPETGRFIAKDPWPGNVQRPATLNRYVYVTNNPVTFLDATGLQGPTLAAHEPLTEEQWRLAKQEAFIFQIPVELVAGTVAVEIIHDTQWHDPLLDAALASALTFHYLGQAQQVPHEYVGACRVASHFLAGYEHYWGLLGGRGPGPGVANFHVGTAKMLEQYFGGEYPDWRVLEEPPGPYARMLVLLSDPGSIHYTAAYLRYWADLRRGSKAPHLADLSDIDMQMIYSGFREDIGEQYGSLEKWRVSQSPSNLGRQIGPFLSFYRRKLRVEYGRVLRYLE